MACDQVECEMAHSIGSRLELPVDNVEFRLHAAAATAALRVISEDIDAAILGGADPRELADGPDRLAYAVRRATGAVVGDPIGT
jgi:hypothetical protein